MGKTNKANTRMIETEVKHQQTDVDLHNVKHSDLFPDQYAFPLTRQLLQTKILLK